MLPAGKAEKFTYTMARNSGAKAVRDGGYLCSKYAFPTVTLPSEADYTSWQRMSEYLIMLH